MERNLTQSTLTAQSDYLACFQPAHFSLASYTDRSTTSPREVERHVRHQSIKREEREMPTTGEVERDAHHQPKRRDSRNKSG